MDPYYVDLTPSTVKAFEPVEPTPAPEKASSELLLPSHVSVFGADAVEILAHDDLESGEEQEDYIEYLDFDDRKDFVRYFESRPNEKQLQTKSVCKNCGEEGHRISECTTIICLTCGAWNEHFTRSCPISKTCYRCGMKGHINLNCPNGRESYAMNMEKQSECKRCGSNIHTATECPTWWRLYEYFTEEERTKVQAARRSKKGLPLGKGGEGYISEEEWCYNCGNPGHWGDDCTEPHKQSNQWRESSAFSYHNLTSGPFFDPNSEPQPSTSRAGLRDWEHQRHDDGLPETWNEAPGNVGKLGKQKSMARMREVQDHNEDDGADWFGGQRNRTTKPISSYNNNASKLPTGPKKISIGPWKTKFGGRDEPPPPMDRSDDKSWSRPKDRGKRRDRQDYSHSSRSQRDDDRKGGRSHERRDRRDEYRDRDRRKEEPGPRYRGSYSSR